jgi:hypothetical protein
MMMMMMMIIIIVIEFKQKQKLYKWFVLETLCYRSAM